MSSEWPRRYTHAELEVLAKSIGQTNLDELAVDRLQEAVEAYQWGSLVDDRIFSSSTNKGRRKSLKHIIALCEQELTAEEIELEVNGLDAIASQLLGSVDPTDRQKVKSAAERALRRIPKQGPDPKRARLHFVEDLICIYSRVTGKRPVRVVDKVGEYGEFHDFVKAALEPFKATRGCESDIKAALHRKRSKHTRVQPL
jgi:hypothetical protein